MSGFPTASGHANLSGNYIPTLYAKRLLIAFYAATVFGSIANTDFEGQIKAQGDTVRIRDYPDITISDYVKGQRQTYENLSPGYVDLVIDKGKRFGFKINDVDKVQSDLAYSEKWMNHASEKLKINIDTGVLADIYSDVHAKNTGSAAGKISGNINLGVSGTPLQLTRTNIVDVICYAGQVLDEQDVPQDNRWLVLPAWACTLLKLSDLKDASLTGDSVTPLRNGRIGMVDRFMIYQSNNLARTADGSGNTATSCIFGHPAALTFASQIVISETLRDQDDFGDIVRSLQVYGYKVVKSEAMGHLYVYQ